MKSLITRMAALALAGLAACNNPASNSEQTGHHLNSDAEKKAPHATAGGSEELKKVSVLYNQIDPVAVTGLTAIMDQYFQVKNALASDNSPAAAEAASALTAAVAALDKSLLTADQKQAYDALQAPLKDNAESIAANPENINAQRMHFVALSETAYQFVKNFGAGRPVYHDHCPMARENQGAMWISESQPISNPYFGSQMPSCGRVEEVIQ